MKNFNGCEDFRTENGSSQGQNPALTGLVVPSWNLHEDKAGGVVPDVTYSPNSAQIRQSRPDSGLDFQVKALETFRVLPLRLEEDRDTSLRRNTPS